MEDKRAISNILVRKVKGIIAGLAVYLVRPPVQTISKARDRFPRGSHSLRRLRTLLDACSSYRCRSAPLVCHPPHAYSRFTGMLSELLWTPRAATAHMICVGIESKLIAARFRCGVHWYQLELAEDTHGHRPRGGAAPLPLWTHAALPARLDQLMVEDADRFNAELCDRDLCLGRKFFRQFPGATAASHCRIARSALESLSVLERLCRSLRWSISDIRTTSYKAAALALPDFGDYSIHQLDFRHQP